MPVPISDASGMQHLPAYNFEIVQGLRHFIAEDAKTARRFLKWFGHPALQEAEILLLNEHTAQNNQGPLLTALLAGNDVGLMSDAGCPGIADPGAEVVRLAHARGVEVVPLVGPSAIVLAVMASGFNGQNFAFNGYLPIEKPERAKRIKELEALALKRGQAQFFIETPYRNTAMADALFSVLLPDTRVFIGRNMGGANPLLVAKTVKGWRAAPPPDLHKVPVVFGIYS